MGDTVETKGEDFEMKRIGDLKTVESDDRDSDLLETDTDTTPILKGDKGADNPGYEDSPGPLDGNTQGLDDTGKEVSTDTAETSAVDDTIDSIGSTAGKTSVTDTVGETSVTDIDKSYDAEKLNINKSWLSAVFPIDAKEGDMEGSPRVLEIAAKYGLTGQETVFLSRHIERDLRAGRTLAKEEMIKRGRANVRTRDLAGFLKAFDTDLPSGRSMPEINDAFDVLDGYFKEGREVTEEAEGRVYDMKSSSDLILRGRKTEAEEVAEFDPLYYRESSLGGKRMTQKEVSGLLYYGLNKIRKFVDSGRMSIREGIDRVDNLKEVFLRVGMGWEVERYRGLTSNSLFRSIDLTFETKVGKKRRDGTSIKRTIVVPTYCDRKIFVAGKQQTTSYSLSRGGFNDLVWFSEDFVNQASLASQERIESMNKILASSYAKGMLVAGSGESSSFNEKTSLERIAKTSPSGYDTYRKHFLKKVTVQKGGEQGVEEYMKIMFGLVKGESHANLMRIAEKDASDSVYSLDRVGGSEDADDQPNEDQVGGSEDADDQPNEDQVGGSDDADANPDTGLVNDGASTSFTDEDRRRILADGAKFMLDSADSLYEILDKFGKPIFGQSEDLPEIDGLTKTENWAINQIVVSRSGGRPADFEKAIEYITKIRRVIDSKIRRLGRETYSNENERLILGWGEAAERIRNRIAVLKVAKSQVEDIDTAVRTIEAVGGQKGVEAMLNRLKYASWLFSLAVRAPTPTPEPEVDRETDVDGDEEARDDDDTIVGENDDDDTTAAVGTERADDPVPTVGTEAGGEVGVDVDGDAAESNSRSTTWKAAFVSFIATLVAGVTATYLIAKKSMTTVGKVVSKLASQMKAMGVQLGKFGKALAPVASAMVAVAAALLRGVASALHLLSRGVVKMAEHVWIVLAAIAAYLIMVWSNRKRGGRKATRSKK